MDYLLLLSTIGAGALTVLKFRLEERSYVRLFNAFTGGYLLCLTFLHLLPELYSHEGHDHASHAAESSAHMVGALILVGFFVQVILDSISMGVEHGHSLGEPAHDEHGHHHHGPGGHEHEHHHHGPGPARLGVPIGVVTGLCLHAFVEAMALGDPHTHHDPASRQMLLASIVIHNYPVSIVLLVMLLHAGVRRGKALAFLGLFAAMAPLGMALSQVTDLVHHTRELTAVVIGIFMHIATTILFESSDSHRFNIQKVAAIVAGVGLGVVTVMMHSHGAP
jgi:zinc transporter ZupT